ncbi:ABC transporter substrate-binding protein [Desulfosarcina ovata]|uniref:Thiamine pyrimidine synthase n=1 Tax=Desulfosarcina ovata subsp. ovata TaxID=2752305 RepID=A0A5K8AFH4_9BACT|nr:ABC transporter substrate-binding protein [Desulfosarcina ovata]BBO91258.1 myristoyl transferase [Desulfosarcina ovata subsp. ovata]
MHSHCALYRLAIWTLLLIIGGSIPTAGTATAGEPIAYRLKWLINASTAGDVVARQQGFFERAGLEVEVKAGGPERDAIRELELGYAQFGVASADQVIRALAKGASVVVVAQLFQVNPLQWIYRAADFSLTKVEDLAGHTVGITYGGNDETIMRALLASAGMDAGQVKLASVRYDYTPFFQKQVAVWPVYRNTQGIFLADKLKAGGETVAFFDPSRYGVRFVANSVVTSRKMLDQHPETVLQFTRALLDGWQAAMDPANEEATITAVAEHDRDTADEVMRRQLAVTRQMIQPDPSIPIGHIDTAAWQQTETIMLNQKLIDKPVSVISRLHPQSGS